jgi:hypothetical protein
LDVPLATARIMMRIKKNYLGVALVARLLPAHEPQADGVPYEFEQLHCPMRPAMKEQHAANPE